MDQQGRGAVSDASIDTGSAKRPLGVSVYDADGEQLGTVSDCQDMRHFLVVHNGRQFGHDTYIPHAAISYSDMNGVHLRLRQGDLQDDLTSMKQQPLPEQAVPIFTALPVLVPDMGVAAVAAIAFTDHATSTPATPSGSLAQFTVAVAQEDTGQAGKEACQSVRQGVGQTTGLVREQADALHERVKSRRPWWRSSR